MTEGAGGRIRPPAPVYAPAVTPDDAPPGFAESRAPLLVTGVPRSGTTWLARLLATAPGTALAGREPMNPRGRQYALGGTVIGWVRLTDPSPRQRRLLRSTYRGWNPRTYGRYGRGQWRGPLPWTRMVVKDPFAMLSVPTISEVTGARALQVYRHPGAVLASYRRMGWEPDLTEIAALVPVVAEAEPRVAELWAGGVDRLSPAARMGVFWTVLQRLALEDLPKAPGTVVVSHSELAAGGPEGARRLFGLLGLDYSEETNHEMTGSEETPARPGHGDPSSHELHRFDRRPADVAESWRRHLDESEIAEIEGVAGPALAELEERRLTW